MSSLSLHFDPDTLEINLNGERYDGRRFLRNLELELRKTTGYPQITALFMKEPLAKSSVTITYDERAGYIVLYYPFNLLDPNHDAECRKYLENWIVSHSKAQRVKPSLPPLHGSVVRIVEQVSLDTTKNRYRSLAHDGGAFIAFYQELSSSKYFMLKHILGVGVVHVVFENLQACIQAEEATRGDCSDFCRLDGTGADLEWQIREFVRKNEL